MRRIDWTSARLVTLGFLLLAHPATAQDTWRFGRDDGQAVGSADALAGSELRATLRCHIGDGSAATFAATAGGPGIGVLMLAPDIAGAGPITISVDGKEHLRAMPVRAEPEGVPALRLLLDAPLVSDLITGSRLQIAGTDGRSDIALSGSGAALRDLRAYCAAGMPDPASVPRPGYDCTRAGTPTERAICAAPELADLDTRLNAAMAEARATGRPGIVDAQRLWLTARDRCGADVACLATRMEERIGVLAGATPGAAPDIPAPPAATSVAPPSSFGGTTAETTADARPASSAQQAGSVSQAPTAPGAAPATDLASDMSVWILGQRPEMIEDVLRREMRDWLRTGLPGDLPNLMQEQAMDVEQRRLYAQRLSEALADRPAPTSGTFDTGVNVARSGDGVALSVPRNVATAGMAGREEDTILAMSLPLPLLGRTSATLHATDPFRLDLPAAFDTRGEELYRSQLVLRIEADIASPIVTAAAGAMWPSGGSVAEADMTVRTATLLRSTADGEEVLHRWTQADQTPAEILRIDPTAVGEVAALYGTETEDGRLLVASYRVRPQVGLPAVQTPGHLGSADETADIALTAMRLAALIAAAPERPLSRPLMEVVLRDLVTPSELLQIVPAQYMTGGLNEIETDRALAQAEPRLREIVLQRAPATPLPVRGVAIAALADYDARAGGFPFAAVSPDNLGWNGRAPDFEMPEILPVDEADALALLDAIASDGAGQRQIFVELDYAITAGPARNLRTGPLTTDDLGTVPVGTVAERLAFYALPGRDDPIFTVAFDAAATGGELPDALYQTTGATLLAAAEALPGSDGVLEDRIAAIREVARMPEASRGAEIARRAANIRSRVPDRFLVGGLLAVDPYDAAAGGVPIRRIDLVPVAHGVDIDGIEPPALRPADPQDYALLPVAPEAAEDLAAYLQAGGGGLQVLFAVDGFAAFERGTLMLPRPSEILVGPPSPEGGITAVGLRLSVPEAPQAEASVDMTVAPPDALMLTPEAGDLMTLALLPEAMDDATLRRMLVERHALERRAAEAGSPPPWGLFFADPTVDLDADAIERLLPAFTDWTRARAASLPADIVLPLAEVGRVHPATGCIGLSEMAPGRSDLAVLRSYDALLGADAAAIAADFGGHHTSNDPVPGPDRAFALIGRPSHAGSALCPSRNGAADAAAGSAYADIVVLVRDLPQFGQLPGRFAAASVSLDGASTRFVPLAAADRDAPGLIGAVVVEAGVGGVDIWTAPGRTAPAEQTVALTPDDWTDALATAPENADIVGLTLGMTEATFLQAARETLPTGVVFRGAMPERQLYGQAVGLLDPATGETILAITATGLPQAPVIAIARGLRFAPGVASFAALRASLERKYGPIDGAEVSGNTIQWGLPAGPLNAGGICGHAGIFDARPPQMAPEDPTALPVGASVASQATWQSLGWPESVTNDIYQGSLSNCGTVVTAIMREGADGTMLVTWLHDEAAARAIDALPKAADSVPDLDVDL